MIKSIVPNAKILGLVQKLFGVTAREASNLIQQHFSDESASYNNAENFYATSAYTAQAVSTASKVALFV